MKTHSYSVCIVASKSRVIYIGMTNNLERHVYEHKNDLVDGFSKKYRCHRLVYFESFRRGAQSHRPRETAQALEQNKEDLADRAPKSHVG
jgi:predicted GIY-YIG superfamily endonuclease